MYFIIKLINIKYQTSSKSWFPKSWMSIFMYSYLILEELFLRCWQCLQKQELLADLTFRVAPRWITLHCRKKYKSIFAIFSGLICFCSSEWFMNKPLYNNLRNINGKKNNKSLVCEGHWRRLSVSGSEKKTLFCKKTKQNSL